MLTQLTIKNYALIHHLEMHPSEQLTVITGETGAGKSIMLGAIGLLLGNRADTKVLWDETEKCITEGTFDIKPYKLKRLFEEQDLDYSDQTVIRREISPGGKSRAFINDTPVTLDVMRKIGGRLMDVHSQHETLELGSHRFQLSLIDNYAGHATLLSDYQEAWRNFLKAKKTYDELLAESGRLKTEYDFIKFQLDELQKASFRDNEQEQLESSLKINEHGEDIKTRLNQLLGLLGQSDASIQSGLSQAIGLLQPLKNYSPRYEQLAKRLDVLLIELKDIVAEAEQEEEQIEFDPKKAKEIQVRLDLLYSLMQKHRLRDIGGLLAFQETLELQVAKTVNLDEDLSNAKTGFEKNKKLVDELAIRLSASRAKVFASLSKQLVKLLRDLGIEDAVIQIESGKTEPTNSGIDLVEILFSANKGIPPRPLEEVASGGEFSRLMFCVKYIMAEKTSLPTLILDEIDTGVSGEIAMQLGKMMKTMSERHQLITISHLPQIAAKGDQHFLVYKNNSSKKTTSEIKLLDKDERIEEIAKMIGGAKPSTLARANAKELLT
ncbi:MAG: DNA repair protein RecN [Cyclobacteriaceae bacterium]|nr:DNA repair protein RecN [Cyclobacteriaceae bacterium]